MKSVGSGTETFFSATSLKLYICGESRLRILAIKLKNIFNLK